MAKLHPQQLCIVALGCDEQQVAEQVQSHFLLILTQKHSAPPEYVLPTCAYNLFELRVQLRYFLGYLLSPQVLVDLDVDRLQLLQRPAEAGSVLVCRVSVFHNALDLQDVSRHLLHRFDPKTLHSLFDLFFCRANEAVERGTGLPEFGEQKAALIISLGVLCVNLEGGQVIKEYSADSAFPAVIPCQQSL
jgi:hypothetical protein